MDWFEGVLFRVSPLGSEDVNFNDSETAGEWGIGDGGPDL